MKQAGEDERLRIEAAQRDRRQFAALYEEHFERVYAFVLRRVRNRDAAQDLTADTFRQALANLERFEWRGVPFVAWLYRIAANAISDHFTHANREVPAGDAAESEAPDEIENVERRATLFALVRQLPPDQRRVIEMRFGEERSIREIAAAMGRTDGAIKQLQWRGMEALRRKMERSDA